MSNLVWLLEAVGENSGVKLRNGIVGSTTVANHARALADQLSPLLSAGSRVELDLESTPSPEQDWFTSGGKELTGYAAGEPLDVRGHPASAVRAALAWLASLPLSGSNASALELPGVELLSERARMMGLSRNAPWSCGGAMRILPAGSGQVALSLSRQSDLELLPAAVEGPIGDDPWATLASWLARRSAPEAAARLQLLGIPAAPLWEPSASNLRPWLLTTSGGARKRGRQEAAPVVVDLTALWAGPLCARLLRGQGARVIKVESTSRPDGARSGSPDFFEVMNAGSEQVSLDFATVAGRDELRALVEGADVVLEASRPRALAHLGIHAADVVASGISWMSITARGRDSDWVGFGDDIAAGAGLLSQSTEPLPAGDALADPLAGVHAAAAVAAALTSDRAWLLDLSMHDVARLAAGDDG